LSCRPFPWPSSSSQAVSKHFGAIQALIDVSLTLHEGEVVGLMGDNGAGKSTLVKIIAGNYPASGGTLTLRGEKVAFHKPADAREAGIEIVYQDLALCDNLTAAENVFLGREPMRRVGPDQGAELPPHVQGARASSSRS
jgi:simple sugar transport system ATP-binding protein